MISILFVIDSIYGSHGGTEKQLLALINGLDTFKFKCHLCCLRNSEWLARQSFPFPVEILSIPGIARISTLSGIRRYIKYLKKNEFDIIHAHYFDSVLLTAVATRFAGPVKLVTSRRGFIDSEHPQKIKQAVLRILKNNYDNIICNSQALAEFTVKNEKVSPEKVKVIYNGTDIGKFTDVKNKPDTLEKLNIPESGFLVVSVSNLRPVKNIPMLIKAAKQLVPKYPELQFVVIGEGNQRPYLEKLVKSYNLSDNFHLVGKISNPAPFLARADIGVLTSKSESLSNTLIEYSLSGLPVVASDVGGNREIIEDGQTGFLFESDNLDHLIEKLNVLIENEQLRKTLGTAGKKTVLNKFPMERCLKEYQSFYEKLVSQPT